ncbi:serine hydrolase domain-containing protein [Sphingomonas hankookensis]|uniref:serine hydrolase domain-containing protein n=1 Tax=Sphingomonas hankookensis TaxID=563996 RepID=UPI003D3027D9
MMNYGRMRNALALTGALLLVQPAVVWAQAAPPRAPARPATRALPATGAMVRSYVAQKKVPGMVVVVGGPDWTSANAAGRVATEATASPVTVDSLWRVYSMTKPITGMAAMMLVEDGKLKLDQPISDFIPGFKSMKVLTDPDTSLASRPATRPITVRNLLTHTAGLGYSIVTKGPLLKEYERLGIVPAAVNRQAEVAMAQARPRSLAEFADRVATLPLIAEPGTRWSYSIGLDVLGRVIEVASGMSFEQFLQTRMFGPLGMRSTYWTVPQSEKGASRPIMRGRATIWCRSIRPRRRYGCRRPAFPMAVPGWSCRLAITTGSCTCCKMAGRWTAGG